MSADPMLLSLAMEADAEREAATRLAHRVRVLAAENSSLAARLSECQSADLSVASELASCRDVASRAASESSARLGELCAQADAMASLVHSLRAALAAAQADVSTLSDAVRERNALLVDERARANANEAACAELRAVAGELLDERTALEVRVAALNTVVARSAAREGELSDALASATAAAVMSRNASLAANRDAEAARGAADTFRADARAALAALDESRSERAAVIREAGDLAREATRRAADTAAKSALAELVSSGLVDSASESTDRRRDSFSVSPGPAPKRLAAAEPILRDALSAATAAAELASTRARAETAEAALAAAQRLAVTTADNYARELREAHAACDALREEMVCANALAAGASARADALGAALDAARANVRAVEGERDAASERASSALILRHAALERAAAAESSARAAHEAAREARRDAELERQSAAEVASARSSSFLSSVYESSRRPAREVELSASMVELQPLDDSLVSITSAGGSELRSDISKLRQALAQTHASLTSPRNPRGRQRGL